MSDNVPKRFGDEHFFVDLVFYHRILKCHVFLELKSDGFTHEHLGQLNTYVSGSWIATVVGSGVSVGRAVLRAGREEGGGEVQGAQ
jgi:hypothetical protein